MNYIDYLNNLKQLSKYVSNFKNSNYFLQSYDNSNLKIYKNLIVDDNFNLINNKILEQSSIIIFNYENSVDNVIESLNSKIYSKLTCQKNTTNDPSNEIKLNSETWYETDLNSLDHKYDYTLCISGNVSNIANETYLFYSEGILDSVYPCYLKINGRKTNSLDFFNGDLITFQIDFSIDFILIIRYTIIELVSRIDIFYNGELIKSTRCNNYDLYGGFCGNFNINKINSSEWSLYMLSCYDYLLNNDECFGLMNYISFKKKLNTKSSNINILSYKFFPNSIYNIYNENNELVGIKNRISGDNNINLLNFRIRNPKNHISDNSIIINSNTLLDIYFDKQICTPFTLYLDISIKNSMKEPIHDFFIFNDHEIILDQELCLQINGLKSKEKLKMNLDLKIVILFSRSCTNIFLNRNLIFTSNNFILESLNSFKMNIKNDLVISVNSLNFYDKELNFYEIKNL